MGFTIVGFVGTVALFVIGVVAAMLVSELPALDSQFKRDMVYLGMMVVLSLLIWGLNVLGGTHLHAIAFVCGVLGWAVWDDFFSEEHGRFRHNGDPRNPEGLNPAEHDGHQPFAG